MICVRLMAQSAHVMPARRCPLSLALSHKGRGNVSAWTALRAPLPLRERGWGEGEKLAGSNHPPARIGETK